MQRQKSPTHPKMSGALLIWVYWPYDDPNNCIFGGIMGKKTVVLGAAAALVIAGGLFSAGAHGAETPSVAPTAVNVVAKSAPAPVPAVKQSTYTWAQIVGEAGLTGSRADASVSATGHAAPDVIAKRWECTQPIRVFYTAAPGVDVNRIAAQLVYPVEYLRDLGYQVNVAGPVAFRADYRIPAVTGDVLIVAANGGSQVKRLKDNDWMAVTDTFAGPKFITSALTTVDARAGLSSTILLHEFGHILGLVHKDGSVMGVGDSSSESFDAGETAAVDCR